jgi:hypothetical protein
MSNRRKIPPQNPVTATIAAIDGAQIPGGCTSCTAYQTIAAHADGPNLHRITVHHDDDCPVWRAIRRAQ